MKRAFIIIAFIGMAFGFTGCHIDPTLEYSVPKEVEPYIEMFRQDAVRYGKFSNKMTTALSVRYVKNLSKHGLGKVKAYASTPGLMNVIELDEDYFRNYFHQNYHLRIKGIIYHEMGHCFLGREHNDKFSLMNHSWTEFYDDENNPKWEQLICELFNGDD